MASWVSLTRGKQGSRCAGFDDNICFRCQGGAVLPIEHPENSKPPWRRHSSPGRPGNPVRTRERAPRSYWDGEPGAAILCRLEPHRCEMCRLAFYSRHRLIELTFVRANGPERAFVLDDGEETRWLDGSSAPMHETNTPKPFRSRIPPFWTTSGTSSTSFGVTRGRSRRSKPRPKCRRRGTTMPGSINTGTSSIWTLRSSG